MWSVKLWIVEDWRLRFCLNLFVLLAIVRYAGDENHSS